MSVFCHAVDGLHKRKHAELPSSKALTLNLLHAYLSARLSASFFFSFQRTSIIHLLLFPITKLSRVLLIAMAGLLERERLPRKMTLTCPVSFPLHRKAFTARVAALLFTVQHRHRHRLKAGLDGLLLIFFHFCQSLLLLAISRAQVQGCADCLCFKTIRRKKKWFTDHTRRVSYPAWILRVSFGVDFLTKDDVMDWI